MYVINISVINNPILWNISVDTGVQLVYYTTVVICDMNVHLTLKENK